jgi:thiosulfate/3-mercaptopyruvate sulfurtransferase
MQLARKWLQRPRRGEPLVHTTLISPADLAMRLSDPDWLVVDCRFELGNPEAGRAAWQAGHIPGAIHADLERDLSAPVTAATGRHPLPPVAEIARTFARFGIEERTQVVCYDAGNGAYASRLWWMLRYLGHDVVALLDGGFSAWIAEGRPVSTAPPPRPAAQYTARPRPQMLVDAAGVAVALARGERLVDVRGAERFAGAVEPLDAVAGHVPGAVNLPFAGKLDARGRFLDPAALAARWAAIAPDDPAQPAICMCGSGVTACQQLFALEVAGISGARLYAGSWSEWIRDPSRPVARDAD